VLDENREAKEPKMKYKDMEQAIANKTEMAVGKYSPRRALISEIRVERRVHTGARWDFTGHRSDSGVRVTYLDERGGENVVAPTEVLCTWNDHEASKAATEIQRQKLTDRRNQYRDLADRLTSQGVGARVAYRRDKYGNPDLDHPLGITVDRESAEKLAELLS
jgi:hypothetical protein